MSEPIVRVGIGIFIFKYNMFLMGQRYGSHGEGTWSVPGGHLEFGETLEEGAAREALEETGIIIANPRIFSVTNDLFPEHNKHYVTIWIESEWLSGDPTITEPDKLVRLEWRTFQDLPAPLFEPCWQNLRKTRPELFVAN